MYLSGSSMATPVVSGTAALMLQDESEAHAEHGQDGVDVYG